MLGVASCLFLMFYLPPSSWWRFVGWLILGLSVYASYGYSHSTVGRAAGRPHRATPALKVAAVGFLLAAIGLFTIPHDASLPRLVREAAETEAPEHTRSLIGLLMVATGLVLGTVGAIKGRGSSTKGGEELV
jgi:hypothetical protein